MILAIALTLCYKTLGFYSSYLLFYYTNKLTYANGVVNMSIFLDSVCILFRQSPRSRLKHVTRVGPTRYWISATGLMVVQGRMREMIPTGARKCNMPTDLSHIQNFLGQNWKQNWLSGMPIFRTNETRYLPLTGGIALNTIVYVRTNVLQCDASLGSRNFIS